MSKPKDPEYLTDEEFARLNGAYLRIQGAQEYMDFVRARITGLRQLGPEDVIGPDGRILRLGRDDAAIAQLVRG